MPNKTIAEALTKAQQFEEEEKFEQAYECYQKAHEAFPADIEILQKLATTAQMLQYNNDAINYWKKFMLLNPQDAVSYNQLLDLYFNDDKYEYYMTRAKLKTLENRLKQATDDYKKAINNTTDEKLIISARYLLAQTYEIIEKPMQAIDEYLKILDYDHNVNVYLSLAGLYYTEDKNAALNILTQAVQEYPDNSDVKDFLCKVYLATGDFVQAEKYAVNKFNKIKAILMQEKNQEAFELLESLTAKEKEEISYSALMAEYYYNLSDDINTLKWIETYEKQDPNSPLASQMRALIYEKQNKKFEAHYNWGKYYLKKGQYDLALDEYLNAYNTNTQNTDIIKELINLYSIIDDKFACSEFCEKLVAIEKNDTATLKRLVSFYEEQGYEDKVIEFLLALAQNNPRDYMTFLKLAKYAEKNSRIDDTIKYYKNYLQYAPNSDEKEEINKRLNILTTGEIIEEDGLLNKIINFFTKK